MTKETFFKFVPTGDIFRGYCDNTLYLFAIDVAEKYQIDDVEAIIKSWKEGFFIMQHPDKRGYYTNVITRECFERLLKHLKIKIKKDKTRKFIWREADADGKSVEDGIKII